MAKFSNCFGGNEKSRDQAETLIRDLKPKNTSDFTGIPAEVSKQAASSKQDSAELESEWELEEKWGIWREKKKLK